MASPIYNEVGKAVVPMRVSGPAFWVTKRVVRETLKKVVMETGYRISRRLGYKGNGKLTQNKENLRSYSH